jgi:hypothetical protein
MPEPHFATADDDLPRTFRREREAREREARERESREREARDREAAIIEPDFGHRQPAFLYGAAQQPAAAEWTSVSFGRLMMFFIKAVFAAIPAIIVLSALLWVGGYMLGVVFPQLPKMQILIHFPK